VLDDPREPELTTHTFIEMVRARVYGILAGYKDQNDGVRAVGPGVERVPQALASASALFQNQHLFRRSGQRSGWLRHLRPAIAIADAPAGELAR